MWINYQESEKQRILYAYPEACALLNIDMDKLRFQCVLHGILPSKFGDEYGLIAQDFRTIYNALHTMKVYKNSNEDPWA